MEENLRESSNGKKKFKISSIIGYIVSILCLLLCLYITIEIINANTHNRPPRIFNLSVSYVPTESMEPTIGSHTYIIFFGASIDDLSTGSGDMNENHTNCQGDIVIYYNAKEQKYIVHRVVEIGEDSEGKYLIVWGDNNNLYDLDGSNPLKVRADMVYGKYISGFGLLNIFSGGVNTNVIFFILVGIFIIMIVMQVVQILLKNKTEEVKKSNQKAKEKLMEEMRIEIMKEELEKLKRQNQALNEANSNEPSNTQDADKTENTAEIEPNNEEIKEEN